MDILITMKKSTETKRTKKTAQSRRAEQPSLLLIQDQADNRWALDEETREVGRVGLAKARAALQATRPAHLDIAA